MHDLFSSDRVACFFDQEQMNMIHSLKMQKSLLSKIFNEKTTFPKEMAFERRLLKRDRCLIRPQEDQDLIDLTKSDRIFFVFSQTVLAFILMLLSFMKDRMRGIWVAEEIIEEYNLVGYYSKRHPYNAVRYKRM